MELPPVKLINDQFLREKCIPVPPEELGKMPVLIHTMVEVMKREKGIGLAANQIGSNYAIFVLNVDGNQEEFINPEVVSVENLVDFDEACLSIPGTSAKTKRYNTLTLRYSRTMDLLHNVRHEETFHGLKAIAIQHEMDHLNGKLYVDQFGPVKRGMVLDKHKKYLRDKSRRPDTRK